MYVKRNTQVQGQRKTNIGRRESQNMVRHKNQRCQNNALTGCKNRTKLKIFEKQSFAKRRPTRISKTKFLTAHLYIPVPLCRRCRSVENHVISHRCRIDAASCSAGQSSRISNGGGESSVRSIPGVVPSLLLIKWYCRFAGLDVA